MNPPDAYFHLYLEMTNIKVYTFSITLNVVEELFNANSFIHSKDFALVFEHISSFRLA